MELESVNGELTQLFPPESESDDKSTWCSSVSRSCFGVSLATLSGLLYGLSTVFIVLAQNGGADSIQVTFTQNIFCIAFSAPVTAYLRHPVFDYSKEERILLMVISVVEVAGRISLFYAFRFGLAGNVTAITLGALPVLTPLFACIYNREPWKKADAINSVFNITGIVLIAGPSSTTDDISKEDNIAVLSILLSILSAAFFAIEAVATHSIPSVHVFVILLYVGAVGSVITFPMLFVGNLVTWHLSTMCWIYLLLEAFCYLLATIGFILALQRENPATVVLLSNIQICVAYIGDVLIFGKTVKLLQILGSVLILASSAIVACYTCVENRANIKTSQVKKTSRQRKDDVFSTRCQQDN
ncbi:solute carrier family 35 member G1-like [Ptychodera flava]|uniref:solute carrier family 35 member G1-like n=1 Tax=Ptychodera flava TaxID=63121 RepID=UPI00396A3940